MAYHRGQNSTFDFACTFGIRYCSFTICTYICNSTFKFPISLYSNWRFDIVCFTIQHPSLRNSTSKFTIQHPSLRTIQHPSLRNPTDRAQKPPDMRTRARATLSCIPAVRFSKWRRTNQNLTRHSGRCQAAVPALRIFQHRWTESVSIQPCLGDASEKIGLKQVL